MFYVYKMESFLKAGINDLIELFSKHDQIFMLSKNKLYMLQTTEESVHKLFLK